MAQSDYLIDGPTDAAHTLVLAHGAGGPMDSRFMNEVSAGRRRRRDPRRAIRVSVHGAPPRVRRTRCSGPARRPHGSLEGSRRAIRRRPAPGHRREVHGWPHRQHGRGRSLRARPGLLGIPVPSAGRSDEASDRAPGDPPDADSDPAGNPRRLRNPRGDPDATGCRPRFASRFWRAAITPSSRPAARAARRPRTSRRRSRMSAISSGRPDPACNPGRGGRVEVEGEER